MLSEGTEGMPEGYSQRLCIHAGNLVPRALGTTRLLCKQMYWFEWGTLAAIVCGGRVTLRDIRFVVDICTAHARSANMFRRHLCL